MGSIITEMDIKYIRLLKTTIDVHIKNLDYLKENGEYLEDGYRDDISVDCCVAYYVFDDIDDDEYLNKTDELHDKLIEMREK